MTSIDTSQNTWGRDGPQDRLRQNEYENNFQKSVFGCQITVTSVALLRRRSYCRYCSERASSETFFHRSTSDFRISVLAQTPLPRDCYSKAWSEASLFHYTSLLIFGRNELSKIFQKSISKTASHRSAWRPDCRQLRSPRYCSGHRAKATLLYEPLFRA